MAGKISLNKMLHVEANKAGLYYLADTTGKIVTIAEMKKDSYYGLFSNTPGLVLCIATEQDGTKLQTVLKSNKTDVSVKDMMAYSQWYYKNKDKLPAVSKEWDEKRLGTKKTEKATPEVTAPAKEIVKETPNKLRCVKVYRTKEPGKPERMTHFDIMKLNGSIAKVDREGIDKIYLNPNVVDKDNLTDLYSTQSIIEGIKFEKWIPKNSPKATWHLRIAKSVEQVVAYGEDVKYICTDVWKEQLTNNKLGKIVKYRLVNEVTKEESFLTRNELWELIKNPYAVEGKNGSDEYVTDKVTGLRVDYYRDPTTGKGSWRLRPTSTVAVHSQNELANVAQTSLDKAETIRCTKAYRVQIPPKSEGKKPRSLYVRYELVTEDGSTYERNTKEILDMMTVLGKTGQEAKDASKFIGLNIQWVSQDDSWRLRLSKKDTPEIIDIPYEEYKKSHTINESIIEKEEQKELEARVFDKKALCLSKGGLAIGIVYRLHTEKGKCVKFMAEAPEDSLGWKEYSRNEIFTFIGEPSELNEKKAKELLYGITLRVGANGRWTVLVANKEPEKPVIQVINEDGERDFNTVPIEEFDNSDDWKCDFLLERTDGRQFFSIAEEGGVSFPLYNACKSTQVFAMEEWPSSVLSSIGAVLDYEKKLTLDRHASLDFYLIGQDGSIAVSSVVFEKSERHMDGSTEVKVYLLHKKITGDGFNKDVLEAPDVDIFSLKFSSTTTERINSSSNTIYRPGRDTKQAGARVALRIIRGLITQIYEPSGMQVKGISFSDYDNKRTEKMVCMSELPKITNLSLAKQENLQLAEQYKRVKVGTIKLLNGSQVQRELNPLVASTADERDIEVDGQKVRIQVVYQTPTSNHLLINVFIKSGMSESFKRKIERNEISSIPMSECLKYQQYKLLEIVVDSNNKGNSRFSSLNEFLTWYANILLKGVDTAPATQETAQEVLQTTQEVLQTAPVTQNTENVSAVSLADLVKEYKATIQGFNKDYRWVYEQDGQRKQVRDTNEWFSKLDKHASNDYTPKIVLAVTARTVEGWILNRYGVVIYSENKGLQPITCGYYKVVIARDTEGSTKANNVGTIYLSNNSISSFQSDEDIRVKELTLKTQDGQMVSSYTDLFKVIAAILRTTEKVDITSIQAVGAYDEHRFKDIHEFRWLFQNSSGKGAPDLRAYTLKQVNKRKEDLAQVVNKLKSGIAVEPTVVDIFEDSEEVIRPNYPTLEDTANSHKNIVRTILNAYEVVFTNKAGKEKYDISDFSEIAYSRIGGMNGERPIESLLYMISEEQEYNLKQGGTGLYKLTVMKAGDPTKIRMIGVVINIHPKYEAVDIRFIGLGKIDNLEGFLRNQQEVEAYVEATLSLNNFTTRYVDDTVSLLNYIFERCYTSFGAVITKFEPIGCLLSDYAWELTDEKGKSNITMELRPKR